MGSKPKAPKIKPIPKAVPTTTEEDPEVVAAGADERRRLAAQKGRTQSVTSNRSTILG